jgi:hypothetical protein
MQSEFRHTPHLSAIINLPPIFPKGRFLSVAQQVSVMRELELERCFRPKAITAAALAQGLALRLYRRA